MKTRGYLVIFEDGNFCMYNDVGTNELQSAYDGYCSIINLDDLTFWNGNEWEVIVYKNWVSS